MYGYIYKFTLIPTNKIYVGKRQKSIFDENYWGSGTYWKRAIALYEKTDIKREILEWCNTKEDLLDREIYWIAKLDARNPLIGYNISVGGEYGAAPGHAVTSEGRLNMSKAAKKREETYRLYPELKPDRTYNLSDEGRKSLSESSRSFHLGRKHSNETKQKIGDKNRGQKRSSEFCNHMREIRTGIKLSDEHKKHLSENKKCRKHINNGTECKFVKEDEVNAYLQNGWVLGRLYNRRKNNE